MPVRYLPFSTVYECSERLQMHLAELVPDVLVMSNTQLTVRYGRELADSAGAALVYEFHDHEPGLLRALGACGAEEAAVLQAAAVQAADGVVTFTDRDARTAEQLGAAAVHVLPCGVEPGPVPRPRPAPERRIVFVGNLYYEPNRQAVQWLHDVLAPAMPDGVVIEVAGRYPSSLRGLGDRLRLRGPVYDLRALLETATLAIAPLAAGGGMKLKVADYAAAGLPVVGTAEAFVGFADIEQWAVCGELDELPEHVSALLADEVCRRRLGKRGRRVIEQHYAWSTLAASASEVYAAVAAQSRHGRAPHSAARALAADVPYWLREWRSHHASTPASHSQPRKPMTHNGSESSVDDAADCARRAAEAATGIAFEQRLVGYAERSVVYLAEQAVLKVYTHRTAERCTREAAGLAAAAHASHLRVPAVLAQDAGPGNLSWLVSTRLGGNQPTAQDEHSTVLLGQVAARLHAIPARQLGELADHHRRLRELPEGTSPLHQAAQRLDSGLTEAGPSAEQHCTGGFVHGDFSSRNVLVESDLEPGVIDVEGSGIGCCYDDLAALVVHESLLGHRDRRLLLESYEAERRRLETPLVVQAEHLGYHLVLRARWILQWALDLDVELASDVAELAPWLLRVLAGDEAVR
jgi:glycosyltransferase involved in cell wall biosynthesis/aminoglycoside phosphotransferase